MGIKDWPNISTYFYWRIFDAPKVLVAGYVGSGLSKCRVSEYDNTFGLIHKWIGVKKSGQMFAYDRRWVIPTLRIYDTVYDRKKKRKEPTVYRKPHMSLYIATIDDSFYHVLWEDIPVDHSLVIAKDLVLPYFRNNMEMLDIPNFKKLVSSWGATYIDCC